MYDNFTVVLSVVKAASRKCSPERVRTSRTRVSREPSVLAGASRT